MKPWTEADSRDLDRAIRAGRQAEQTERLGRARGRAVNQQGMTTVAYDGVPRGYLTDDDLRRRKKVSRAMQVRADRDAKRTPGQRPTRRTVPSAGPESAGPVQSSSPMGAGGR